MIMSKTTKIEKALIGLLILNFITLVACIWFWFKLNAQINLLYDVTDKLGSDIPSSHWRGESGN